MDYEEKTGMKQLISNLSSNLAKHWLKMTQVTLTIPIKAAQLDWKGVGYLVGDLMKEFIEVPDG